MRKQILIWTMIVLLIPTLACGLSGSSDEAAPVEVEAEAPAEETTEAESSTATEAETQLEAEAESSAEDSPGSDASAAEEESEAEAVEDAAAESASGEAENVDLSDTPGLDSLASYRISFHMGFEGESGGQPANGTVNILLEASNEPPAKHLTMNVEGTTMDQFGGTNVMEIYQVDDTVYMYNEAMGRQWISMPGSDSEAFSQGFFSPDENLQVPDTAKCASSTETVNGIATTACTFNATDLEDIDEASYDKVDGKVWLAKEGGYVVKYEVNMEGFKPTEASQQGLFDFGNVTMTYEILEVDTDVTIDLPAEAQNAQSLDFGALTGGDDPASADVPVLEDAEELFTAAGVTTYVSASTIDDAIEFYRQALADEGWSEDTEGALVTGSNALLTFEKDGSTLTISITRDDGGKVSVNIISS